jgi:arsenate reductase (thioredoxin)
MFVRSGPYEKSIPADSAVQAQIKAGLTNWILPGEAQQICGAPGARPFLRQRRSIGDDYRMAKKKVLFVCMGNCVRSQIAEALAKHHCGDVMIVESAGLRPLGFIDPTARAAVEERGVSMDGQFSKGLHDHGLELPDMIINMSGLPGPGIFHGHTVEDWKIADPFGEDLDTHRRICDDIDRRIQELAARFRDEDKDRAAGA